jgi:hypothetical protein
MAALAFVSWRFYTRAPIGSHAPMQWGFDGKPTWRAPRLVAALFTPTLAALVLAASAMTKDVGDPGVLAVVAAVALVFVVIHAGHLHFALRDVNGLAER